MGHSEYDLAAKDRRPWNAGRMLGAKRALKPQQVWAIRFWLDRERRRGICQRDSLTGQLMGGRARWHGMTPSGLLHLLQGHSRGTRMHLRPLRRDR